MKRLLFIICIALTFIGCSRGEQLKNKNKMEKYDVITIDGCKYLQYGTSFGYLEITHKGDCSNSIHYQYPIDSAEVAIGYLRSNGAFKD